MKNLPNRKETDEPSMILAGARKDGDSTELAARIFSQMRSDFRYSEFVLGCLNCGECTTGCPAARFYDFSPREMLQIAMSDDPQVLLDAMQEKIWACCQCYTCNMRCRFGNDIAGIISVMRELAVKNGLESTKEVLKPASRSLLKVMTHGTQVSPDMIQPDFFVDWDPKAVSKSSDLAALRKAIPIDVLQVTDSSWEVSMQTALELAQIYEESGVLDMLRALDPDLVEMILDIISDWKDEFEDMKEKYGIEGDAPR
ncbi:MAG: 4Fe-4S dicluster domain-containing protein [Thermoplasmata archaeon]|uniref:4Fe-4S dicluster domain-containing protein n=1 Tax=Candidatus Sysuiplasma superficiale TaxID=2823368 RepID=A0A8J8CGT8_9ARCH|nr:4Fe-4S dicluster domain-containing protein [Candidatus Sysuiplasma superficiale]MBX8643163.1 4Fe-4S dicluster domain-containing protein [Candidatus Sysuiplasma superficiale]MCL4346518.1 4Fe-4S dicluster domain-containing protein [Candidatus Thermoplasmatota archaeon]